MEFGHVVLLEAALSFLGVRVPLGIPSHGSTIDNGTLRPETAHQNPNNPAAEELRFKLGNWADPQPG